MYQFHHTEPERLYTRLIATAAAELGTTAYIVGGFVRDRLLGRTTKDIDIVTVGSGIELAERFAALISPIPRVTVYKNFGTAMLHAGGIEFEFVGARRESYRSDSRKPIVENGTLTDDQNRRDFTINALAVPLTTTEQAHGDIIDPFSGLNDIDKGIIRTPLIPDITFSDDPLRMFRAIRFATQLGFEIEADTLRAIVEQRERTAILSAERITVELEKVMTTAVPSIGFKLLFQTGLLKIVLPEVAALHGVEVREGIAHKDNFYHTLQVVDNLATTTDNIWLRWAALFHDIAKPATKRFTSGEGWSFRGHETVGARWIPRIFGRLKLPLDAKMKYVQKAVELHMRPIVLTQENITDSAVRRLLFEAGDDIDDLMLLCRADITTKSPIKVQRYLANYDTLLERIAEIEAKDHLRNWQPPITGEVIMETFAIKPSKEVGIIKNAIREAIIEGLIPNEYEAAHALMLEEATKLGLLPA